MAFLSGRVVKNPSNIPFRPPVSASLDTAGGESAESACPCAIEDRFALIFALAFAAACPGRVERPKTFLVVTFDTEDYVTPEAERIDDIPKWLAETMTEEGVTGTFFVIGEKARSLEKRGRRDVIAAMAQHDIGSHTELRLDPPHGDGEAGEGRLGRRACGVMREQESAGIEELERIFGVPVTTLARHGGSYGPQLVFALGRLGAGYQGSPASLPGHDVVWFCNALNFSAQYAGFDDAYYRDDLFEPVFDKLKKELPGEIRKADVLALFAGHPTKIRAEEFWDLNFYYGKNTPPDEWRTPRLRPQETMATARKNFRRMMRWLKGRDDIEITTYRALMDIYGAQKETMTREELRAIAAAALETKALAPTADFSPAEAFSGLARAIVGYQEKRASSRRAWRRSTLSARWRCPRRSREIASRRRSRTSTPWPAPRTNTSNGPGPCPASLEVGGVAIGTGSLFALFSAVYLDLDSGRPRPEYDVPEFEPYPRTNEKRDRRGDRGLQDLAGPPPGPRHVPDRRAHAAPALDPQARPPPLEPEAPGDHQAGVLHGDIRGSVDIRQAQIVPHVEDEPEVPRPGCSRPRRRSLRDRSPDRGP